MDFPIMPAQRFWQATISLLDVMWPQSNQWERALLGKKFLLYYETCYLFYFFFPLSLKDAHLWPQWYVAVLETCPSYWESTKGSEERGQCKMQTADYCSDRHEQHGGSVVFLQLCGNLPPNLCNCQRVSQAKTVGLRGGQLNATQSIAAGRKILDCALKSVTWGVDSLGILVALDLTCSFTWLLMTFNCML